MDRDKYLIGIVPSFNTVSANQNRGWEKWGTCMRLHPDVGTLAAMLNLNAPEHMESGTRFD